MVKNKFIFIISIIFISSCFFVVISRLDNLSQDPRPSQEDLQLAMAVLAPPPNSQLLNEDKFSNLTYIGMAREYNSSLSFNYIKEHFDSLSKKYGWMKKKDSFENGYRRVIFCSGNFAYDIEISSQKNGHSAIRSGVYWFSDKGDDRFCRG